VGQKYNRLNGTFIVPIQFLCLYFSLKSIAPSLAQAENESRSDNINMGIQKSEALAVRLIFESYLAGYSIIGLRKLLLEKGIRGYSGC
jgi:hypothetical protein